jgi:opacity protein-like surface antigen
MQTKSKGGTKEMIMKKRSFTAMVIFLVLFGALVVPGRALIYIGAQAGWSAQKPSLSNIEFSTNTSFLYGLRAGLRFMGMAVELNYFQAAHNMEPKDFLQLRWKDREVDYNYIGVNGKIYFPIPVVQPYLTAGYGYYTADIHDIDKDKNGGFNFGLGAELMLGKRFSLTAEGKYHHVKLVIDNLDLTLGDFTLTGGFNINF